MYLMYLFVNQWINQMFLELLICHWKVADLTTFEQHKKGADLTQKIFPRCSKNLRSTLQSGKGDFAPINLQYGQALRFYGNMCCHYTVPNVSDTCRVSFDMRVLSLDHHDPEWTDRLDRKCLFKVGQYYRIPKQLSDWKRMVLFILIP